jgi:TetR/AcrR family transcriptional regulator, regulator of autoinduction and epiphytic fitness
VDRKSKQQLPAAGTLHAARFPRRQAAAARTRAGLVRAASELFAERGYAATTVPAIAERAGVARATVFTSVPGGKPELLKLARDVALAGDDDPVPVPQRPWFREAMSAPRATELLRLQARNYRMIHQRAAALERCLVTAAATAPELAELLADAQRQRAMGTRLVIDRLIDMGAVPPQRRAPAADILYALASPDVYLLLTEDRDWTAAGYEQWLYHTLTDALLNTRHT